MKRPIMQNKIKLHDIIESDLCCGCGTCYSICPTDAISMGFNKRNELIPKIDNDKCISCNLCYEVCPNKNYNYNKKDNAPICTYSGYSKNKELRFQAASGGLVTQFLLDGLESQKFDAIVAVNGNNTNEFKAEILTTAEDVLSSKGSKYNQISVNQVLKELKNTKYERICYMGLPCHIRGLNRYLQFNKKLSGKIVLKLSLVCGQVLTKSAISKQLDILNLKEKDVRQYSFRGNGWPGKQIITSSREEKQISYTSKLSMGGIFSSPLSAVEACTYCEDHYGMDADISFCDTWHSPQKGKCDGLTSAICWSEKGKEYIEKISGNYQNISLEIDDFIKLKKSQGHGPTAKINYLLERKTKNKQIKVESKIRIKFTDKFLGLTYNCIFNILKIINLKYYPKSILATSRLLKRFLR